MTEPIVIHTEELERLTKQLNAASNAVPGVYHKSLSKAVRWAGTRIAAKPYPPPPPNSKYIRTGRLKASWNAVSLGRLSFAIKNNAAQRGGFYGAYVVGGAPDREEQAWMHKGRWWIARDEIEDLVPEMQSRIEEDLTQEINKRL